MILITGGTGFLGKALIKRLLEKGYKQSQIRVVARNEGKLIELKQQYPTIDIITGDIVDEFICKKACANALSLYHLAAFKHVGLAEQQPIQCVATNIQGTLNLLKYFRGLRFLVISTDKAAQVSGVYGASKLLMEKMVREYEQAQPSIDYRIVRYGNVLYSTGSVLCKWKELLQQGKKITITDPKATRFFWSVDQAINLIFDCINYAKSSTPYCPTMKAMTVGDLAYAMWSKYGITEKREIDVIGLQPGENMHEKILEQGPYSNEVEKYTVEEIMQLI